MLPWGALDLDVNNKDSQFTLRRSLGDVLKQRMLELSPNSTNADFNILALSGGGAGGAYGAGVLNGWKDNGTLPDFDVVTAISTGSIMASFAFLGGEKIAKLDTIFNNLASEDLYTSSWLNIFSDATLSDPTPLKMALKKGINEEFLIKIAAEHKKGRRLYVGTTNLDTGQLVVWDMGAIAASDHPDKVQRYRDIIYASCAVPVIFPPHFFEIPINGEKYSQMHVDGGVYSNVFMVGMFINWVNELQIQQDVSAKVETNLYIIANKKYRERHEYEPVPLRIRPILNSFINVEMDLLFDRSVSRIYHSAKQKGVNFHMATIPQNSNDIKSMLEFVPSEMREVYKLGYGKAIKGYDWQTEILWNEYDLKVGKPLNE
ncbi:patatin-like phospholipase family protein [Colwellia echini]|nr:patatin-like phospholipase family protein [Colwellia echini]